MTHLKDCQWHSLHIANETAYRLTMTQLTAWHLGYAKVIEMLDLGSIFWATQNSFYKITQSLSQKCVESVSQKLWKLYFKKVTNTMR